MGLLLFVVPVVTVAAAAVVVVLFVFNTMNTDLCCFFAVLRVSCK